MLISVVSVVGRACGVEMGILGDLDLGFANMEERKVGLGRSDDLRRSGCF